MGEIITTREQLRSVEGVARSRYDTATGGEEGGSEGGAEPGVFGEPSVHHHVAGHG